MAVLSGCSKNLISGGGGSGGGGDNHRPTPNVLKCDGPACCGTNNSNCLVQVINYCPYPIYLFNPNHNTALLVNNAIPENSSVFVWPQNQWSADTVAIAVAAGQPMMQSGTPNPNITCKDSDLPYVGNCEIGWNDQNTLFEVSYVNGVFSYDISAVDGFTVPMTVVPQAPDAAPASGGCGRIHTGSLDVNNCAQNMALPGIQSAPNDGVRAATYFYDFSTQSTGNVIDCHAPPTGQPIQGCRSSRSFGTNYVDYFYKFDYTAGSIQQNCQGTGTLLYNVIPASQLSAWTCVNPSTDHAACLPPGSTGNNRMSTNTDWYQFIKSAIDGGTTYNNIYAFPADDAYINQYINTQSSVVKNCSASKQQPQKAQFVLYIGGPVNGGAQGGCPSLIK